jgi:predicted nucleic acid-binding protein
VAVKILDSWALMALFNDEPAADEVEALLEKAGGGTHKLLMCVVNWGEIYYSVMRGAPAGMARQKEREIAAMPIELVPVEADLHLVRQAAIYKATHKISYADAFAAALAKIRKAELVTPGVSGRADGDAVDAALGVEIKIVDGIGLPLL